MKYAIKKFDKNNLKIKSPWDNKGNGEEEKLNQLYFAPIYNVPFTKIINKNTLIC